MITILPVLRTGRLISAPEGQFPASSATNSVSAVPFVASLSRSTLTNMAPDLRHPLGDAVVWSPRYLEYSWTPEHPMNPARLDLTMRLATSLKLLEGVE